jgi:transcriptional regulator with XRE-family HTH domain
VDTDWQASDHTLGGRISIARETASLSSAQVARRLGIKSETLRNWETDRSEPRANRLTMLAGVLNVSPGWLLSGKGEGPPVGEVSGADVLALQLLVNSARREQQTLADTLNRLEAKISHLGDRVDQGQWSPEPERVD